ncbi:MAG TPA: hypothetical protein VHR66_19675 [Gemmataceae bacterium]|jgi:hypothetical protein|nr:hypothetical protein [Gemmataceae bacterium]
MSTIGRAFGASIAGLVIACGAFAQEKDKADPAPKTDDVSAGFRAFIIAEPRFPAEDIRNRAGKMQDLVTDHGLEPVLAVFSRTIPADASHPLAAVVKKFDELDEAKEYKARRLGSFLVFLSLKNEFRKDETRDARIKEIGQFVSGIMPKKTTVGLAEATETPDGTEQPLVPAQVSAMGIGAEDDIVVVLYNRFHVIKRWKFPASKPPTDEDLKAIDDEVVKLLGPRKK